MSDPLRGFQFLYTSAPFGDKGYDGLQFVGLPEDELERARAQQLVDLVNYTLPPGTDLSIEDREIDGRTPVAYRMLPIGDAGAFAVLAVRYGGKVYHQGRRGKWGNVFAHAVVVAPNRGSFFPAEFARGFEWRRRLTEREHDESQTIYLPALEVGQYKRSCQPLNQAATGLLRAVLARFGGANPAVMIDSDSDALLGMFRRVQAFLPSDMLSRLAWSTYEIDGAAGYDVMATSEGTRLHAQASMYLEVGETPVEPVFAWAADACQVDPGEFWRAVRVLGGFGDAGAFRSALTLMHELETGEIGPHTGADLLTAIESVPVGEKTIALARKWAALLSQAGTELSAEKIARTQQIAQRLEAWSGEGGWSSGLSAMLASSKALRDCFADPPDTRGLEEVLGALKAGGTTGDDALCAVVEASASVLEKQPARTNALSDALWRFISTDPSDPSVEAFPAAYAKMAGEPALWPTLGAVLKHHGATNGLQRLEKDLRCIERMPGGYRNDRIPGLFKWMLESGDLTTDSAWLWRASYVVRSDEKIWAALHEGPTRSDVVAALDRVVGEKKDSEVRSRLARAIAGNGSPAGATGGAHPRLGNECPNSVCVLAIESLQGEKGKSPQAHGHDVVDRQTLANAAPARVKELAHATKPARAGLKEAGSFRLLEDWFTTYWREDLAEPMHKMAVDSGKVSIKGKPKLVQAISIQLRSPAGSDPMELAWRRVLTDVAGKHIKRQAKLKDRSTPHVSPTPQQQGPLLKQSAQSPVVGPVINALKWLFSPSPSGDSVPKPKRLSNTKKGPR